MSKFNEKFDQITVSDELKNEVKTRIMRDKKSRATQQASFFASKSLSKPRTPVKKITVVVIAMVVAVFLAAAVALPSYIIINNSQVNAKYADLEKEFQQQTAKLSEQASKLDEQNGKLNEQTAKLNEQNSKLNEQADKLNEQAGKIDEMENENLQYKDQIKQQTDRITELKILSNSHKILILERADESSCLKDLIKDDYDVTVTNIAFAPDTMDALTEYGQIILMNIANADMPQEFDKLLYSYVHDYGGGLLTVGGNKIEYGETVPNAYDRNDMRDTLYQKILPVECINYTPPVAIMLVIDCGGSMSQVDSRSGKTQLELAKDAAIMAVNALTERDYVGIIAFNNAIDINTGLIPAPQRAKVLNEIASIDAKGGTIYNDAIQKAGLALQTVNNVAKKHIIFFSDGEPGDNPSLFYPHIERNYDSFGITLSTIGVISGTGAALLKHMSELGHGNFYDITSATFPALLNDELRVANKPIPFKPVIMNNRQETEGINETDLPELGGFYGTKAKIADVDVILADAYGVPVYAKWQFGKGKVGSFMCDLKGTEDSWSYSFMNDSVGIMFIKNMIKGLCPRSA